jgi:hypothetical protein
MEFWSPLYRLIEGQRKRLRLTKPELARRCGCQNIHKGICWIDAISKGHIDYPRAKEIMERLPGALEIDQAEFDRALAETQGQIRERTEKEQAQREAEMRARFRPHGFFITEHSVPTQIVMCGLTGGPERWLRIELDLTQSPITFVRQAINVARRNPTVPFFGEVLGVVINYTFDCSVRLDLTGNPIEALDRAYAPGKIELTSRGREVGPGLRRALGL